MDRRPSIEDAPPLKRKKDASYTPACNTDQHPHLSPAYIEDAAVQRPAPPPLSLAGRFPAGEDILHTLYNALPSPQDTARIATASSHHSVPFHEILTTPYSILDRDGLRAYSPLLSITGPGVHPVLIARHMLHLASFLQHLHPDLHDEIKGLSEPPSVMRERLAEMAIRLVTTQDQFVGSVEFLKCIMIQSLYEANCGHLRRSWMTARRAMAIAQSMGFHQSGARLQYQVLHPDTKAYPHFMWFRIVFYDRQMCLLLGMPEGSPDRTMGYDAMLVQDTRIGRLERQHCVVMSRLLESSHADPVICSDYSLIRDLDREQKAEGDFALGYATLVRAAVPLQPPQPAPSALPAPPVGRAQVRLLSNHLRQCFTRDPLPVHHAASLEPSRLSCRTIDFIALMAAMTLLLAHLNRYRYPQIDDFLAAQALGDRAMIEQAQEHIEVLDRLNADPLSARSARLLRRLLAIEARAADGEDLHSAQAVRVQSPGSEPQPEATHSDDKHVYIPYFGVIQAAGEIVSAAAHPSTPTVVPPGAEGQAQTRPAAAATTPSLQATSNNVHSLSGPFVSEVLSDNPMQLFEYPGMAGGRTGHSRTWNWRSWTI
ncbi:fungal specific transcription factor domain-containing protein [Aspergillus foveolatus]|uniref:fungal specific transcription factor domain-containing protein n=1 Tax=Aspergillus foveolatus TaxID=210207 RepID=UPI003CCDF8D1